MRLAPVFRKAVYTTGQRTRFLLAVATILVMGVAFPSGSGQESSAKEPPKVALCIPFHVANGTNNKVTIRGWRLNEATAVRLQNGLKEVKPIAAKIVNRSNAPTIDKYEPKRIGDQQLEVQLELPKEMIAGDWRIVVVTPAGESEPHPVAITGDMPLVQENEPNDGFRQAQQVSSEQWIAGTIHANQNVDVFAIDMPAGKQLQCEVVAARFGSLLDPLISVYDSRGNMIGSADDGEDSRDATMTFTTATTGRYFITIQDANDRGSSAHGYVLKLDGK